MSWVKRHQQRLRVCIKHKQWVLPFGNGPLSAAASTVRTSTKAMNWRKSSLAVDTDRSRALSLLRILSLHRACCRRCSSPVSLSVLGTWADCSNTIQDINLIRLNNSLQTQCYSRTHRQYKPPSRATSLRDELGQSRMRSGLDTLETPGGRRWSND